MARRRLMLTLGPLLVVGGMMASAYSNLQLRPDHPTDSSPLHGGGLMDESRLIPGFIGMAVGAGLIWFGVLRPTNHKDE